MMPSASPNSTTLLSAPTRKAKLIAVPTSGGCTTFVVFGSRLTRGSSLGLRQFPDSFWSGQGITGAIDRLIDRGGTVEYIAVPVRIDD